LPSQPMRATTGSVMPGVSYWRTERALRNLAFYFWTEPRLFNVAPSPRAAAVLLLYSVWSAKNHIRRQTAVFSV
jgi:hypothetical protein